MNKLYKQFCDLAIYRNVPRDFLFCLWQAYYYSLYDIFHDDI